MIPNRRNSSLYVQSNPQIKKRVPEPLVVPFGRRIAGGKH